MKEEIILEKIENLKKINKEVPELVKKINHLEFSLNLNSLGLGHRSHGDDNETLRYLMLKDLRNDLLELRGE